MPKLVKVSPGMFEQVHRDLLHTMDARVALQSWQRLFTPGWDTGEDHVGYALQKDGRIVGFAAYLYAPPFIGDPARTACNFSTWVVDPAFRSQALRLVMPALSRKDLIVTNLTALRSVHEIFVGLGFHPLETHLRVHRLALTGSFRAVSVALDRDLSDLRVSSVDETIIRAHRAYAHVAVVETSKASCLVVYTLRRRRGLRTARLHHISPADGLTHGFRALQWALFRRHGACFVEYDRRLVVGAPLPYRDMALEVPRLFRATGVLPAAVTNAFSELILLNI